MRTADIVALYMLWGAIMLVIIGGEPVLAFVPDSAARHALCLTVSDLRPVLEPCSDLNDPRIP